MSTDQPNDEGDFYTLLIEESHKIYGDHGIKHKDLDIVHSDLNDPELIKEGKDFVKRNFYSVMLAHLISLMWIFTFKPGREVLLRSGYSSDMENSRARYLSTLLHIKSWYESDTVDHSAEGSQDLYRVRKMHAHAAGRYHESRIPKMPPLTARQREIYEAVKKATAQLNTEECPEVLLTDEPEVPISQLGMTVTQFCFIGFILLFPETYGITDKRGIDGFVHLWAIFGRRLGIEDRFNLAIHYKKTGGDLTTFKKIYNKMFLPFLKMVDETDIIMWDALIEGSSQYMKQLNLMAAVKFMLVHGAGLQVKDSLDPLMTWRDRWFYAVLIFATHWSASWELTRRMRNAEIYRSIDEGQQKFMPRWNRSSPDGQ